MPTHEITSLAQHKEVLANHPRTAIIIWTLWSGPSRIISPVFEGESDKEEFKDIYFAKVDADAVPEVSAELNTSAIPTFFFFKDGVKIDQVAGASPPRVEAALKKLAEA